MAEPDPTPTPHCASRQDAMTHQEDGERHFRLQGFEVFVHLPKAHPVPSALGASSDAAEDYV